MVFYVKSPSRPHEKSPGNDVHNYLCKTSDKEMIN